MQRRDFLKSTVAVAVAAELGMGKAQAKVPAHNWGNYDFGSGPQVGSRVGSGTGMCFHFPNVAERRRRAFI